MSASLIPFAVLATSLIPAVVIFFLPDDATRTRTTLNLGGAAAKGEIGRASCRERV